MTAFFETILRTSLAGSAVILAVLLARLALRKAPKKITFLLWAVVLMRLLLPGISVELPFGTQIDTQLVETLSETPVTTRSERVQSPRTHAEAAAIVHADASAASSENTAQSETPQSAPAAQQQVRTRSWLDVLSFVWLLGVLAIAGYSVCSLLALKKRLRTAAPLGEGVYEVDVETPFVLGVLRPKIYLPAALRDAERAYIVLHERLHIKSGDHIVKLVAFAALTLHWFNPLVWLAFSLAGQDMEMRCDEAVMARTRGDVRADYAQSLLNLSAAHRRFAATPLAFGEGTCKARIKNILKWKKPAVIGGVLAAVAVVALIIVLACQPAAKKQAGVSALAGRYRVSECVYQPPTISMYYTPENTPRYMVTSDGRFLRADPHTRETQPDGTWQWRDDALWSQMGWLQSTQAEISALQAPFDEFSDWEEAQSAKELVSDVTDVWRADTEDGRYVLLLQSKKNGLLLMACKENRQEGNFAYYLWKLERVEDALALDRLEQELRDETDDQNLSLFAFYEMENGFVVGGQSGSRMSFAIYETQGDGYRVTAHADMGRGALVSRTITQTAGLETSITIALSYREDLSYVTARAEGFYQSAAAAGCPAMAVFVWPEVLPEGTQADVQFYNAADERMDAPQEGSDAPQPLAQTMEEVLAALPELYNDKAQWLEGAEDHLGGAYYDVNSKSKIKPEDMEAIYGAPIRKERQQTYPNEYDMIVTYPGGSQASGFCNDAGEISRIGALYLLPADGVTVCGFSFGTPWQDVVSHFLCESAEPFHEVMYDQQAILLYGTYVHFGCCGFIAFDESGSLSAVEYWNEGCRVRFCFTDGLLSAVAYQEEEALRLPYAPAGEETDVLTVEDGI